MNADHAATLALYCEAFHQQAGVDAELIALDTEHFVVRDRVSGREFSFRFDPPVHTPNDVRTRFILLARQARAQLKTAG